jgi:hypothetical protein
VSHSAEELTVVQAGPEGSDGGKPDMFAGQEEASPSLKSKH